MFDRNLYAEKTGRYIGWMADNSPIVHQRDPQNPYEGNVVTLEGVPIGTVNTSSVFEPMVTGDGGGCFYGGAMILLFIFSIGFAFAFYKMWEEIDRRRYLHALGYLMGAEGLVLVSWLIPAVGPVVMAAGGMVGTGLLFFGMFFVAKGHKQPWKPLLFGLASGFVCWGLQIATVVGAFAILVVLKFVLSLFGLGNLI